MQRAEGMHVRRSVIAASLVAFATAVCAAADPPSSTDCVRFWAEARYRPYGYDHIVHLVNVCKLEARCLVSTDVDPEPMRVIAPPEEHIEVTTRRGSPASQFMAAVVCRLPE
jgi:hypothetical protein